MAVSAFAKADISRGFCGQFLLLWDYEICFSFVEKYKEMARHQRSWQRTFLFSYFWGSPLNWARSKSRFSWALKCSGRTQDPDQNNPGRDHCVTETAIECIECKLTVNS